ncbi:sensor domain-containing protein [Noviherbaspirillum aerium]|uniref:sensor domain-containing protein n=1 Tax=Noviherbaspirillum aerium TaxID=2588497 RepID=UPI00178C39AA|nr:EAL domain-containing protein [Noviherbaspirillum aerium]
MMPDTDTRDGTRRLADEAPAVVWEMDMNRRCVYLDPGSAMVVPPEAFNFDDWISYVHPDDAALFAVGAERARAGHHHTMEYRIVRSDGSVRWLLSNAAPRHDDAGNVIGLLGSLADVTSHYESKERLLRSEAEHRLLTENAGDMIAHLSPEGRYVYVSPSHRDFFGYEPEDMVGKKAADFLLTEDLDHAAATRGTRPRGLATLRGKRRDGSTFWISINLRAVRDPDTGERKGLVAVGRDITPQVEAERELALREERFHSLTKLSTDWYWEVDTNAVFTFISEGIEQRLGLQPKEIIGRPMTYTAHDMEEQGVKEFIRRFAAKEPFRDLVFSVGLPEYPGVVRHVRMSGEPFHIEGVYAGYRGATTDVTREIRIAQQMQKLATVDALTDLPNRSVLDASLSARLNDRRGASSLGVFFLDLDRFKEVNDSLGHRFGDELLREVARRLRACMRPDDLVARLGGDEFVVLAECRRGVASAARLGQKLLDALATPLMVESQEIKVGGSVGISLYPQDATASETLLSAADTALYRVKEQGGGTYRFFTSEMRDEALRRHTLQQDMRGAAARGEFTLHYQPRVNLRSLEVVSAEALIRWQHPALGNVPPGCFIPLAEENGCIAEIGTWVLAEAIRQASAWRNGGRMLNISVNLSPRQLHDRTIVDTVRKALAQESLPPEILELEITESALMEDQNLAISVMRELKQLGVRLSIDDFGTGYSSLSHLRKFPLDGLKLDRSFLDEEQASDVNPLILAESIIDLAHALKLTVVAEGVENAEHLDFLRRTSCDEIQGYVISKPLPAAEFEAMLASPETLASGPHGKSLAPPAPPAGYPVRIHME